MDFIVSPLIKLVVGKAADSAIQHISQIYHLKDNFNKLSDQLLAIQVIIADAENRSREDPSVQVWLKRLRPVAYQADDVLDDFRYEALRRQALDLDRSSVDPARNVVHLFISRATNVLHPKNYSFSLKMSKKLNDVLKKIKEIITDMNIFKFVPSVDHYQLPIIRPPTVSCIIESDIIGRDGEKEVIVNILTDPSRNKNNISVFSIVGMGGAGKTALAQLVYNEKKVDECFQKRMWICVSNDFNVVNIVKSIIDVATNGKCESTSDLEVLQKRLHKILANKKFLLILDDVWNEKVQKWDTLKTLLFSIECIGSVIIVTTRSKSVASIMGTLSYYDLTMLSEENSWKLFQKKAFGDGEISQQFAEIGRIIVGKCAGLPLALKVIGALLRNKRQVHEWRAILKNTIWDNEAEISPVLKLSYDQLAPYTKQCFAYCALFPQGCEISIEYLIHLWMANGFIPDDETMDLEEKGWYIFEELYSRCFFQDIKEYILYGTKIIYCKMHDLMHDLAKDIAGKQCASMLDNGGEEVLHLLISSQQFPKNSENDLKKFTALRTCLFWDTFQYESENENLSDSMKSTSLRALRINHIYQLPMELGYIKHLRYLDLSYSKVDILPETICKFYNLQTLNLCYSKVSKLPEHLRDMISLRHLLFYGCSNLKRLSVGLGQLTNLRTLTEFMVDCDPGLNIRELKNLNNLHGYLVLSGLENVRDRNEAEEANMVSKTKISSLVLKWDYRNNDEFDSGSLNDEELEWDYGNNDEFDSGFLNNEELEWDFRNNEEAAKTDEEVLEGLKPYKELNYLSIEGYQGFDFPTWMKEVSILRNVTELILKDCINCIALPPLWKLPLLEKLYLDSMRCLLYICSTGTNEAKENGLLTFPNLKKLVMNELGNLEGWHEKDHNLVAFPKLEELEINDCPKLTSVPYTLSLKSFNSYSNGIRLFHISNMDMAASSKLTMTLPITATEPDAFKPPKNVEIMILNGFENVIPLEEYDKQNCHEMSLLGLVIESCNCFFLRRLSKLALGFWKHFASLEKLTICDCNALSSWPEQEFRSLKCLKYLKINNCKYFTCSPQALSLGKKYGEDILPQLETLIIDHCSKLVEIPKIGSKSLKGLYLSNCPSLFKEGLNWLKNLHQLKELYVKACEGLKSLPDGLEGLISLESLVISDCPGIESFPDGLEGLISLERLVISSCSRIESFPEGLQQRLSQLQHFEISYCPALEKQCKSRGYYFYSAPDNCLIM